MPTPRQIAAQQKRDIAEARRDIISRVTSAVLRALYDSQLHGSSLWPKNGFIAGGYRGDEKIDTITIGINVIHENPHHYLRFNIWGKERRVLKQRLQLVLILDCYLSDVIYFTLQYPEFADQISAHYHDGFIMDMLDFKFTINK